MRLSDSSDRRSSTHIDEVRAKIFYLASDVESVSRQAAMLLRAVAEAIDDVAEGGERSGRAAVRKVTRSFRHALASEIRAQAPHLQGVVPPPSQHVEPSVRSGHKP